MANIHALLLAITLVAWTAPVTAGPPAPNPQDVWSEIHGLALFAAHKAQLAAAKSEQVICEYVERETCERPGELWDYVVECLESIEDLDEWIDDPCLDELDGILCISFTSRPDLNVETFLREQAQIKHDTVYLAPLIGQEFQFIAGSRNSPEPNGVIDIGVFGLRVAKGVSECRYDGEA